MKYGIRTTTHRNVKTHGIEECLASGDITRQHALIAILVIGKGILHHLTGSSLKEFDTVSMGSEDGTIARQRETDGLRERIHRVGGEHA